MSSYICIDTFFLRYERRKQEERKKQNTSTCMPTKIYLVKHNTFSTNLFRLNNAI